MLNIKTIKKLLMLAVALVMLFTAAFFCCNTNLAALAQGEPTAEEVDDYLRDNGYSEEFIAQAGQETKLNLYEYGAVFEGTVPVSMGGDIMPMGEIIGEEYDVTHIEGDWEGFEAWLTVSDASNRAEEESTKIVTMTWDWFDTDNIANEAIGFGWSNDYVIDYSTILFEVSGTGNKVGVHMPPQIQYDYSPQTVNGTLMTKRGNQAFTSETSTQQIGVGYCFGISYYERHRIDYGTDYYAEYTFVPGTVSCSYSFTITKEVNVDEQSMVVANYFNWVHYIELDFDFSFSASIPPSVSLSVTPNLIIGTKYEKSTTMEKRFLAFPDSNSLS